MEFRETASSAQRMPLQCRKVWNRWLHIYQETKIARLLSPLDDYGGHGGGSHWGGQRRGHHGRMISGRGRAFRLGESIPEKEKSVRALPQDQEQFGPLVVSLPDKLDTMIGTENLRIDDAHRDRSR